MDLALTFDDFPCMETEIFSNMHSLTLSNIVNTLEKCNIKNVCSFVNGVSPESKAKNLNELFDQCCQTWLGKGHCLANHTYSHPNLLNVTADDFIQDIQSLEFVLTKFKDQTATRYFRYPYLSKGDDLAKYQAVKSHLDNGNYQVAPVTIDTKDYIWAAQFNKTLTSCVQDVPFELEESFLQFATDGLQYAKMLSDFVFKRPIKHVVLLHFNYFTSLMLEKLILLYQRNGVQFISLNNAMTDSAYHIDAFDPSTYNCLFTKHADLNYQLHSNSH